MYAREAVLDGEDITLRAVFVDGAGNFINTTSLPSVYIYDDSATSELIDAEVTAGVFSTAVAGPLVPTLITEGFYEVTYTVPSGATGYWTDLWVGDITSTTIGQQLHFNVINGADVSDQRLYNNELIIIDLDKSIADYQGKTLASDIQLSFLTTLSPYYASTDLVRMEIGSWIDFIPDSTLALMIHWSSKEAEFISKWSGVCNTDRLAFSRAKFVSFDAVLRAMYLPGSFAFQPGGVLGTTKRLGDLSITNGNGAIVARTASGIDTSTLAYLKDQRAVWFKVVNSGGALQPGESFAPALATKGKYDPMRRNAGRQWADTDCNYYEQPGVNRKSKGPGGKGKFYWDSTGAGRGNYVTGEYSWIDRW